MKKVQSGTSLRQPLTTLSRVTVLALLGCACASVLLLQQICQIIVPIVIVDIFLLVVALLVATGIRWMPLLGSCDALGTMIGGLVTQQYFSYHLTHPEQWNFFSAALLVYTFGFITVVAGISATVQNYRSQVRTTPRFLTPFLTGMGGFVVGAIIVSLLVQAPGAAAANGTATTNNGTVHMGVNTFNPSVVTIRKGANLTLLDDGQFFHVIDNGEWVNTSEHVLKEPGAPLVNSKQVNGQGNTIDVGPFTTAGTYHLFCTVHPGMNLTVIVQ